MNCERCFEMDLPSCQDVAIAGIFPADTSVKVVVRRSGRSKAYFIERLTDSEGKLIILQSDFPPGYLMPGYVSVSTPEFVKDGNIYSCILIYLIDVA